MTRDDGLPADDICKIAFAPDGTAFIGTQTQGVVLASLKTLYRKGRKVPFQTALPTVANAEKQTSIPSGQINDIIAARDGAICVATTSGLAVSRDNAQAWNWQRGQNWNAKVRERLGGAPADWEKTGKPRCAKITSRTSRKITTARYLSVIASKTSRVTTRVGKTARHRILVRTMETTIR